MTNGDNDKEEKCTTLILPSVNMHIEKVTFDSYEKWVKQASTPEKWTNEQMLLETIHRKMVKNWNHKKKKKKTSKQNIILSIFFPFDVIIALIV